MRAPACPSQSGICRARGQWPSSAAATAAGTSRLVAPAALPDAVAAALDGRWPRARPIPLWDGQAGARMAAHLAGWLGR